MKNEIWTFIPSTNGHYQISNLGRIRKVNSALKNYGIHIYSSFIYEMIEPKLVTKVYLDTIHQVPVVRITLHGMKFQKFPISELMFLTFHGIANIQNNEIIHIDGNEENNELDNLVLSKSIFKLKYLAVLSSRNSSIIDSKILLNQFIGRVSKYSKNGELKKVFTSVLQTEREEGILRRELLQNIKARSIWPIKEHFYKKGNGPQLLDFSLVTNESIGGANFVRKQKRSYVLQYSKEGRLMALFDNVQDASQTTQCLKQNILNSIKTRHIIGHYLWVQLEDQTSAHTKSELHFALGHE